jgi:glucose-6-phosphate isomerase
MSFTQNISQALQSGIGATAVPDVVYKIALNKAKAAIERLRVQAKDGSLPLLTLPMERADIASVKAAAKEIKKGARDIIILGTGGSSLGGQTLAQLKDYNVPGLSVLAKGSRLHFMDNLDAITFQTLLTKLDLKRTRFIAISKSGGTGETLMQTIACLDALKSAGLEGNIGKQFLGLSEPVKKGKTNALRTLLAPYNVPFLDHHTGVGGRYSVLSNTGLLPAAIQGLDIVKLRKGAASSVKSVLGAKWRESAPVIGAALQVAASENGKNITVLMPYTDRLERLTKWFVQLWAESLGKTTTDGVRHGTQPVGNLGPVDQHSAQQLFLAGPHDKLFTVVTIATKGLGSVMSKDLSIRAGEPGFAGRTIGDLVDAQSRAMIETFAKNGCAVRHIHIEQLNEESLGALLMHFMLETIIAAYIIGVDPFDQPAVEEAKILAKKLLEK